MGLLRELYRSYLVARHRPRHWRLRPDTIDRRIFRHVVVANEYALPDRFSPREVVVDIGGHVGCFALAALRRGATRVVVREPDAANFAVVAHNLAPYEGRVDVRCEAVWRSDQPATQLAMHNPVDSHNTGAGQVRPGEGVSAVAFDDLIDAVGGRVRLVKLDCEGAEWPVLLTSRRLHLIDELCGEYHLTDLPEAFAVEGVATFTPEVLRRRLESEGFRVRLVPTGDRPFPTGLFFAGREVAAKASL